MLILFYYFHFYFIILFRRLILDIKIPLMKENVEDDISSLSLLGIKPRKGKYTWIIANWFKIIVERHSQILSPRLIQNNLSSNIILSRVSYHNAISLEIFNSRNCGPIPLRLNLHGLGMLVYGSLTKHLWRRGARTHNCNIEMIIYLIDVNDTRMI